jgi:outer membrane immunogenic protein
MLRTKYFLRTAIFAGAIAIVTAGGASADGPRWSGLYMGIHAGYAWGESAGESFLLDGTPSGSGTLDTDGPLWGMQVGYNLMLGPNLRVGVEGDFSLSAVDGSSVGCGATGCSETDSRGDWAGTARGRLGYATNGLLIYATGGFAFAHGEATRTIVSVTGMNKAIVGQSASVSGTNTGYVYGGGVEWAFAPNSPNWSLKFEYLRRHFDDNENRFIFPAKFTNASRISISDSTQDSVRIGLNYRFGPRHQPTHQPMK